eukprot:CFRG2821T1
MEDQELDNTIESLLQEQDLKALLGSATITETITSVRMLKRLQSSSAVNETDSSGNIVRDDGFHPSMSTAHEEEEEPIEDFIARSLQMSSSSTPARRATSPPQISSPKSQISISTRGSSLVGLSTYDDDTDSVELALAYNDSSSRESNDVTTKPLSPGCTSPTHLRDGVEITGACSSTPGSARVIQKRPVPEGVNISEVVAATSENISLLRKEIEELTENLMNPKSKLNISQAHSQTLEPTFTAAIGDS